MIARVAESCFWLHRYVERVDNTARLMAVNFAFLLDIPGAGVERWRPLLVVAGVEELFIERVGAEFFEDGERAQEFLVWSEDNPFSALNSLRWARDNAHTIRETLSLEAWTAINRFWLWMTSSEARKLYEAEPSAFYDRMRESCQFFHGVCHDTLLHDDPFEFMRLGMFLERAAQTARILDTKYHAVGPSHGDGESSIEVAEWMAILRSCSAYEPFFKRASGPLSGRTVAAFLLFDPSFPRSVHHCLLRAWNFLQLIGGEDLPRPSADLLLGLLTHLQERTIEEVFETGLHAELTEIIDRLAFVCEAVVDDYFSARSASSDPETGAGEEAAAGPDPLDEGQTLPSADFGATMLPAVIPVTPPPPPLPEDRRQMDRNVVDADPARMPSGDARILQVDHETVYTYDSPVRRSSHIFLLRPVDDERQDVLDYELSLSIDGRSAAFEDVFGNQALSFRPRREFSELRIHSRARVRVRGTAEPERVESSRSLPHPVVWMPWQRMMMLPYLMPPELPESQLSDLSRFALDFIERNDGDLVRALQDINQTIHATFDYEPGSTTVETTPYETFIRRRGVCQDFAYLFIILAQLLNVPARYRVGYIYTGGDYEGQVRSDASHAWAEVYLPQIGWYGFDPANGKATGHVDYVRVATGRHYRDAAPVSGTIFEGGGGERLDAWVRVELVG